MSLNRVRCCAFSLCLVCVAGGSRAGEAPSARTRVLRTGSFWRVHRTLRQEVVGTGPGDLEVDPPEKRTGIAYNSPLPPEDWMQPAFDDSGWARAMGPFLRGQGHSSYGFGPNVTGLLCLRGKFGVTDPAAVKGLALSLEYRGGVVVYLNGDEVTRAHLPRGEITFEAPAEGYPLEASTKPDGSVIRWGWRDPSNFKDRAELRRRRLESVPLPSAALRKGTNVVAIELHRAPVHPGFRELKRRWIGRWARVGLHRAEVHAEGSAGVQPNVGRPAGFHVWNVPITTTVFDVDYGDPNEPLRPIRVVGARNGSFSGQVAVGCDQEIKGLKAEVSALKRTEGEGSVAPDSMDVRYPLPAGSVRRMQWTNVCHFDALSSRPPGELPVPARRTGRGYRGPKLKPGVTQPIWLRVRVPRDAEPGTYEGTLTITAAGRDPVAVPVRLRVADWSLPDPRDFVTLVDFVQSPETVAYYYKVPLWSDEHFERIAASLRQLGRVGNKTIYIHLLARTNHGNAQTMVRWTRTKDGTWQHDFSIVDRYLDLCLEHVGKPRYVIFYVSDRSTGGGYFGRKARTFGPFEVTAFDPTTGKAELHQGPGYGSKEILGFLKPVAEGIRERLKERGLLGRWHIGCTSDVKPAKAAVLTWKKLAPEAKWVHQGHGLDGQYHGVPVGYNTTVWKPKWAWDPSKRRRYGWRQRPDVAWFNRDIWRAGLAAQSRVSRIIAEKNITGLQGGFGRMSADFWPCIPGKEGTGAYSISARYEKNSWKQCNIRMPPYLSPGPDGARSTARFEMIIEGVQECEARIFVEKALLDKGKRARLGDERAGRLQALLDERTRFLIWNMYPFGWQDRSARLFDAAAEVARVLAK
ncbi:MAG: DUF6067 family protein [Planctomycetota bacterium]